MSTFGGTGFSAPFNLSKKLASRRTSSQGQRRLAPTITSGFVPRSPRIHRGYNMAIGLLLILAVLPLILLLTVLLLVTQGRPIFYGGDRLGKDRKTFQIYKFRSLDTALASKITANQVLPRNSNIETPLGKYIRASRLDELPQLWNIVRGDMNIVGPRPVRAEIARLEEARNKDYGVRFSVKPGLIGPTQAYMSHGTSKRLRARFNYKLCHSHVTYWREIALFVNVGLAVLAKSLRLMVTKATRPDPARTARTLARSWGLTMELPQGREIIVNGFAKMDASLPQIGLCGDATLILRTRQGGLRKARVTLTPIKRSKTGMTHTLTPASEAAEHIIFRYLMDDPVVCPEPPRQTRPAVAAAPMLGATENSAN